MLLGTTQGPDVSGADAAKPHGYVTAARESFAKREADHVAARLPPHPGPGHPPKGARLQPPGPLLVPRSHHAPAHRPLIHVALGQLTPPGYKSPGTPECLRSVDLNVTVTARAS